MQDIRGRARRARSAARHPLHRRRRRIRLDHRPERLRQDHAAAHPAWARAERRSGEISVPASASRSRRRRARWCSSISTCSRGSRSRRTSPSVSKCASCPPAQCRERAERFVRLVGLDGFAGHYPHELSGGMQQRVGLARALALDPEILLIDEPFGALDAITREQLQREIADILAQSPKTVVFITHNMDEAIFFSDRILVMGTRPGPHRRGGPRRRCPGRARPTRCAPAASSRIARTSVVAAFAGRQGRHDPGAAQDAADPGRDPPRRAGRLGAAVALRDPAAIPAAAERDRGARSWRPRRSGELPRQLWQTSERAARRLRPRDRHRHGGRHRHGHVPDAAPDPRSLRQRVLRHADGGDGAAGDHLARSRLRGQGVPHLAGRGVSRHHQRADRRA